jgi:inosine-uridine nucleoside N-ribohydrolase
MKVIIDTDCGVDDAFAILFGLESYDVIAITCVSGNSYVDNVCNNVGVVTDLVGKHIPIYRGSKNFILSDWNTSLAWAGHGDDGLGGIGLKSNQLPEEESAIDALIRLSKEHDDISLITLGPLTNIAIACLIDPNFPKRIKSFTIMGGAHQCKGNVKMATEFNIDCDPEAAKICLNKFPMTRMVTWETCYKCSFDWAWYDSLKKTKYTEFIKNIFNKLDPLLREYGYNLIVCDLIAMTSYLTESEEKSYDIYCDIELTGQHTRGSTVFAWNTEDIRKPNCRIVKINMDKVYSLVENVLYKC